MAVAFYISGHGYGHASRQIEIINSLGRRNIEILIRTSAPRWLFDRTVRVPFRFFDFPCDTAIVQIDSLRLDEEESVRRAAAFYATFEERVAREAVFLHEHRVALVVSDAPPLACAAAEAAGRPSVVISNFTWDWIYSGYAERFAAQAPHVIPTISNAYSTATEGWRLPMHGGFGDIHRLVDLPWVARHATMASADVLARLSVPAGKPIALMSFGGYGLRDFDPRSLDCLDEWTIVMTGRDPTRDLPQGVSFVAEKELYASGLRYEDLVAASDVVVTKPGYGIISECVANDSALLYTSRGRFVEYDVMVREMPRVLRCAYIDQASLLGGRWHERLNALRVSPPPPERPATNGAEVAAERLAAMIGFNSR